MIRDVNIETQQRRHRSEEAFRLPQTQVIDGTNSQRSLDGEVRIDALTARLPASPDISPGFGNQVRLQWFWVRGWTDRDTESYLWREGACSGPLAKRA